MAGNRKVTIEILGEPKSAQKAFQDVEKSAEGLGSRLSKIFGGIGQVAAGFLTANVIQKGVETLKTGISESISAASDLNESLNKNRVLFGDMSGQIEQFANTSAAGFGISKNAALEATGIFGNLFRAMEIGQKPAADMSTKLVGLAGDLASFNNADPSEVLEALRAGLVGETEPLRRYGVNISAAAIAQKALSMGIADSTANLTPAQKAQATYALILEQTSLAQGDFARTSSGLANSERILAAEWQNIIAIVGGVALPLVTTVVVWFAQRLPGAIDTR